MTFEEWIKSTDGIESMKFPVTDPVYLRNRLWYAFNAGVNDNAEVKRLQSTIDWYEGTLKTIKTENKHMADLLAKYSENE